MNYFVTGIGTNVGKTIVSAILTEALKADYWKPIQSGVNEGTDSNTVRALISNSKTVIHPESYLLKEPLSPNIAAKKEEISIAFDNIILPITNNHLIIEGAGGLLVPINTKHYVIDIAKKTNCEIILVISNYLGCINHSILSIDYLLNNNYKIKYLVFNGLFDEEVKQSIINYDSTIVTIDIPYISEANQVSILNISNGLVL